MKPRIKPIKLKILAVLLIDALLFITLIFASYALLFSPARAENVDIPNDTYVTCQTFNNGSGNANVLGECPTDTVEPSATCTLEPSPTNTLEPSPTNTPEPSPTNTLEPSPTNTVKPSPTNTLEPSPTNTLVPSPTYTLEPSATNTLEPSPTNTLVPSPTYTLEPSATNTLVSPSPSRTPEPSVSPTQRPTSTHPSTSEPSRTPSATITPTPKSNTPAPSPTSKLYTSTPSPSSTSEVVTCPACYIIKDFRELVAGGFYTASLLNTESISSTLNVSITLYNEYKGVVVGDAINMVDTQPANEIMQVDTPLWCKTLGTGDFYWIHSVVTAQTSTSQIWFVIDEWVRIRLSGPR